MALDGIGELIDSVLSRTPRETAAQSGASQAGVNAAAAAVGLEHHRAELTAYRKRVQDSHDDGRYAMQLPEREADEEPDDMGDSNITIGDQITVNLPEMQSEPEPKTTPPPTEPSPEPQPQSPVSAPKKTPGWQKAAAVAALVAGGIGAGALGTHLMQPKYVDLRDVKWEVVEETDLQGGVKIDVESD